MNAAVDPLQSLEQYNADLAFLRGLLVDAEEGLLPDAARFYHCVRGFTVSRDIWSDAGEIAFEWIAEGLHAVASTEGDGFVGYAMLVDGEFVPGAEEAVVTRLPSDLAAYLRRFGER